MPLLMPSKSKILDHLRQVRGNNSCLAGGVIQPTLFHYLLKPIDTCSFYLNIEFN